jgi:eukaryotic-like serine/threonine-protein kinase
MTATAHTCPDCGTLLPAGQSPLLCAVCALNEAAETETEIQGYTLLREIARGGMGVVYEAQQRSLQRTVALKVLPGAMFSSGEFRQRFQREAETAAQLSHPGIVTVHEVGSHQGQPFIAMEMIHGPSLAELLQAGPLKAETAAQLLHQVALALVHAHERQVIHRDLKPSNILLRKANEPVLTDFGLARFIHTGQTLTRGSHSLGSPGYLPPERVVSEQGSPSFAEDVYGLGAVLYHCLTGRPPFVAESIAGIFAATVADEPAPLRVLNPKVPLDLETICLHCLEKRPSARYASAAELAEELARYLRGEPVLTRPVGPLTRLLKKARRQPVLTALSLALVLAIITGFTASLLGWRSAAREAAQRRVELYSSQITAAGAALEGNHPAQAKALLQTLKPGPGETDLRGPEWYMLQSLMRPRELQQHQAHERILTSLSWSPDGQRLLSGGSDGGVKLWALGAAQQSLTLERELVPAGMPRLHQAVWADAQSFLCAEQREWIRYRSVQQPEKICWQLPGAQFAWCAAKRWLAVSGGRPFQTDLPGDLKLYQVRHEGEPTLLREWGRGYRALAISSSGRWLAAATAKAAADDAESGVKIWDLDQPQSVPRQLATTDCVWSLHFSPDEQQLVVIMGLGRYATQRFAVATGKELSPLQGHLLRCWTAAFSAAGDIITTGSDRSLRSWKDGVQTAVTTAAHENEIWTAALHPQQRLLATGDKDGVLKLFPYPLPNSRLEASLSFPHGHYEPLHFTGDSKALIVSPPQAGYHLQPAAGGAVTAEIKKYGMLLGQDKQGRFWQWQPQGKVLYVTGESSSRKLPASLSAMGPAQRVLMAKQRLQVIFIYPSSVTARWDLDTGELLVSPPLLSRALAPAQFFIANAISEDGRYVSLADWRELGVYDFSAKTKLLLPNDPHWARDVAFAPAGDQFASAGVDGSVMVRRMDDGVLLHKLTGHLEEASGLTYSPEGRALVTTEFGIGLRFWRTDTWRQVLQVPLVDAAEKVTFSPDGRWLALIRCPHGALPSEAKVMILQTGE